MLLLGWFVKFLFVREIFFIIEKNFWSWRFYNYTQIIWIDPVQFKSRIVLKSSEFNSNPQVPGDGRKTKVCEQRLLQPG